MPLRPDDEPGAPVGADEVPCRLAADHPARAEALARHQRAVQAGLSTYLDPATGLAVLTADYLLDRGYCCNSRCRHCPYPPDTTDTRAAVRGR